MHQLLKKIASNLRDVNNLNCDIDDTKLRDNTETVY